MKQQHYIQILLLGLAIFSFSFNIDQTTTSKLQGIKKPYSIEGKVRGKMPKMIYIVRFDSVGKMGKIDSAKIQNGKFNLNGELETIIPCMLGLRAFSKEGKPSGIVFSGEFVLDSGITNISFHVDSLNDLVAKGTKGQDEFYIFKLKTKLTTHQINAAFGEKRRLSKSKDKKLVIAADQKYNHYATQFTTLILSHVKQFPSSIVSAFILSKFVHTPDVTILKPMFDVLSPAVQQSAFGKVVAQKLLASDRTAIGKMAPAFSLPDMNGKLNQLNAFQGKFILIDFWASWCGPCRLENPNLIRAYAQYKSKGFEIIGVSMDNDKKKWLDAVKQDNLPWVHLSDLKAAKGEIKSLYGINSIPMNFLLDKEGKIVARNLRGTELATKLAQLLH